MPDDPDRIDHSQSENGDRSWISIKMAPHLLLLVTQFIFSAWHILGSAAMKSGTKPLIFALYRETISSVLMLIYALSRSKGETTTLQIDYDDFPRFIFVGFCSFVNVVGTVLSLKYITASGYAILQPAIPIIATVISCIMRIEELTVLKAVGITVAAFGAILTELGSISKVSMGLRVCEYCR